MKRFHINLGAFVSLWLKEIRQGFFYDQTGRFTTRGWSDFFFSGDISRKRRYFAHFGILFCKPQSAR